MPAAAPWRPIWSPATVRAGRVHRETREHAGEQRPDEPADACARRRRRGSRRSRTGTSAAPPRKHTTPATSPMASGGTRPTNPAHGVIATRPATAPDAAPSVVALPRLHPLDARSQPSIAAAAREVRVHERLRRRGRWRRARYPALKPNQPNQRMPGAEQRHRQVVRRHRLAAASRGASRSPGRTASAATPALMCTTVPPAKSSAPSLTQPAVRRTDPVRDRRVDEDDQSADEQHVGREPHALGDTRP